MHLVQGIGRNQVTSVRANSLRRMSQSIDARHRRISLVRCREFLTSACQVDCRSGPCFMAFIVLPKVAPGHVDTGRLEAPNDWAPSPAYISWSLRIITTHRC